MTTLDLTCLTPLPRDFYARDPRTVARELLGKLLIRRSEEGGPHPPSFGECGGQCVGQGECGKQAAFGESSNPDAGQLLAGRIVEAEAYLGAIDPGAHAYRGQTPRNAVLFGPPGHAYIYFIYGNHYCTNVSCQPPGDTGCGVLLRALEPVSGLQQMAAHRGLTMASRARSADSHSAAAPSLSRLRLLTSGPGRLSQALGITRRRDNASDLCSPAAGGLYIADDGYIPAAISATPRINVTRAPIDEWRFIIPGNSFVSGRRVP